MGIIYQKDKRSGITYAYENESFWDKELKRSRSKRKLIGRLNVETGEIVPTDGRCKKNSPYQKPVETPESRILDEIKPMKISELRKEVVRLRLEVEKLKEELGSVSVE